VTYYLFNEEVAHNIRSVKAFVVVDGSILISFAIMRRDNLIWRLDYVKVFKDLNVLVRLPLNSLLKLQSPIYQGDPAISLWTLESLESYHPSHSWVNTWSFHSTQVTQILTI